MLRRFQRPTPTIDPTQVLTALARVAHPESGRDIVQLKMVKDLVAKDGTVSFTILLDEIGAPIRAPLERQVRASLAGVAGVRAVKIDWQARNVPRPQTTDKLENLVGSELKSRASHVGSPGLVLSVSLSQQHHQRAEERREE